VGIVTKEEAIGVKRVSGRWEIVRMTFQLDNANNFRTIYPVKIPLSYSNGDKTNLIFLKNTKNNRTLYRETEDE